MAHAREGEGAALFLFADEAQAAARLSPDGVASSFAPRQGDDGARVSLVEQVAGERGEDAGIVVGVRAHEHQVDVHQVVAGAGAGGWDLRDRGSREKNRTERRTGARELSCHPRCLIPVSPAPSL